MDAIIILISVSEILNIEPTTIRKYFQIRKETIRNK